MTAPDYDGDEKRVLVRADRTEVVRVDLVQSYGLINIQGSPQGAKVDLTCAGGFNKVFGLPGQLSVPHGPCTVVVKRVGYKTFSRTVQIAGGGSETVDVSLQEGEDVVAAPTPTYTPPEDTSWSPSSYGIVPFVNRPALLADEAGEAFLSFDLGLDASSTQNGVNYGPAKRVGMDLGFGYGMGFAEVDVKLKAMRYVSMGPGLNLSSGTPVAVEPADHAILLPGEPNGTNYGGAAFGGIDLGFKFTLIGRAMGAEIALEVPGKHVSDNKVRFRFAFPFKITFKDDIVAFHGNLGSTMGFANSSDWGVNIQMSVWANYGLSFNVMRRWYVDVTSSIWKWVLPDSNPLTPDGGLFIGLQVMTGVTIVPGLDMTLASTLNDLYNHGAESRDLIFGMSYHFGDY